MLDNRPRYGVHCWSWLVARLTPDSHMITHAYLVMLATWRARIATDTRVPAPSRLVVEADRLRGRTLNRRRPNVLDGRQHGTIGAIQTHPVSGHILQLRRVRQFILDKYHVDSMMPKSCDESPVRTARPWVLDQGSMLCGTHQTRRCIIHSKSWRNVLGSQMPLLQRLQRTDPMHS